jgi:hypothetical protein
MSVWVLPSLLFHATHPWEVPSMFSVLAGVVAVIFSTPGDLANRVLARAGDGRFCRLNGRSEENGYESDCGC